MIKHLIQRFTLKTKYVIIAFDEASSVFTFLTYGTRGVFKRSVMDVSLDSSLVADLDVTQACFLGFKVAEFLQYKDEPMTERQQKQAQRAPTGVTQQVSFDRYGNVIYVDPETEVMVSHSAMEIAKNDQLLRKFASDVGYAIGLYAGKRMYIKSTVVMKSVATSPLYKDNVVDLQPRRAESFSPENA